MKRICVLFLMCISLLGCKVYPTEIERAVKSCEPHGGLNFYAPPAVFFNTKDTYTGECHCVDGTVIQERDLRNWKAGK